MRIATTAGDGVLARIHALHTRPADHRFHVEALLNITWFFTEMSPPPHFSKDAQDRAFRRGHPHGRE